MIVGGTGLYVRALAEGLFAEPALGYGRRRSLDAWTARWSRSSCCAGLRGWTPAFAEAAGSEPRGPSRWRCSAASRFRTGSRPPVPQGIARSMVHCADRSSAGVASADRPPGGGDGTPRLDRGGGGGAGRGTPAERPGIRWDRHPGSSGVPARDASEKPVAEAITINTRQYAKRQQTWFRHQLGGQVTDPRRHPPAGEAGGRDRGFGKEAPGS